MQRRENIRGKEMILKRKRRRENRRKREKEEMIPKRDRGGGMRGGDALGKSVGARRLI